MKLASGNIMGVKVSAINMQMALEVITGWIDQHDPHYVCVTGAHGVLESQEDPELKDILNSSGMNTPDGMPNVWLLRAQGHSHVERVYGPDLMLAVCESGLERGWRHFFYGGAPKVPQLLKERLEARFPGLQVCGIYSPPFRPLTSKEEDKVVQLIQKTDADIVWVGISTPKQERWMKAFVNRLRVPVLIGVGAAFDFHAGIKKQAPRWIQRSGFEWLFRFMTEPRRLWRRYLKLPRFAFLSITQLLGLKHYDD
jgi:N-acetylglucosaminyldiphosphoundecaprenol N-acetyl-beta-D-mannosaminyltransferase